MIQNSLSPQHFLGEDYNDITLWPLTFKHYSISSHGKALHEVDQNQICILFRKDISLFLLHNKINFAFREKSYVKLNINDVKLFLFSSKWTWPWLQQGLTVLMQIHIYTWVRTVNEELRLSYNNHDWVTVTLNCDPLPSKLWVLCPTGNLNIMSSHACLWKLRLKLENPFTSLHLNDFDLWLFTLTSKGLFPASRDSHIWLKREYSISAKDWWTM